MSSPSSTSSSRKGLLLGTLVFAAAWLTLERLELPRTGYFGGRKLAEKLVLLEARERDGPIEVFVVGPSFVDQGFDAGLFARETGRTAFNLGVSGTDMVVQSMIVRDHVLPRRPRTILWALRDSLLSSSKINQQYLRSPALAREGGPLGALRAGVERRLPTTLRRRALDWWREAFAEPEEPLDEHGRTRLATATRAEFRALRAAAEGAVDPGTDVGLEDGPGDEGAADALPADELERELAPAEAHVEETLRRARALGIEVWLLMTPYPAQVFRRHTPHAQLFLGEANLPYYDWLARLGTDFGARLLDLRYCAEISPRRELFYDGMHLNTAGSEALAHVVAELTSGRRAVPAEWLGFPASAERDAVLPPVEPERVPVLALGRVPLERALRLTDGSGQVTDVLAAFDVERAGDYRLLLRDESPRARAGSYFLRFGGKPHYRIIVLPGGAHRVVDAGLFALPAGRQTLELRTRTGEPVDWSELLLAPEGASRARAGG
jgi:hypothetical protein